MWVMWTNERDVEKHCDGEEGYEGVGMVNRKERMALRIDPEAGKGRSAVRPFFFVSGCV